MIKFVKKSDSKLMLFLNYFIKLFNKKFMSDYWTTIGTTIYYPDTVNDPLNQVYSGVVEHEMMHVRQFESCGIFFMFLLYALFPLPILFSGRWLIERRPYLNDLVKGRMPVMEAVDTLWNGYLFPWPKKMMEAWFIKNIEKIRRGH